MWGLLETSGKRVKVIQLATWQERSHIAENRMLYSTVNRLQKGWEDYLKPVRTAPVNTKNATSHTTDGVSVLDPNSSAEGSAARNLVAEEADAAKSKAK